MIWRARELRLPCDSKNRCASLARFQGHQAARHPFLLHRGLTTTHVSPLTSFPSPLQPPAAAFAAPRCASPRALVADAAGSVAVPLPTSSSAADTAAPPTPSAERQRRRTHGAEAAGAKGSAPLPPTPPCGAPPLSRLVASSSSDFVQAGTRGSSPRAHAAAAVRAAVPRGARSTTLTMSGSSDASALGEHSRSIVAPCEMQGSGVVSAAAEVEGEARRRALLSSPHPQPEGSDCDVVVVKTAAARVDAAPAPPAASSPVAPLSGHGDGPRSTGPAGTFLEKVSFYFYSITEFFTKLML